MRLRSIRYPLMAVVLLIGFVFFIVAYMKDKEPSQELENSETKLKEVIVVDGIESRLLAETEGLVALDVDGERIAYAIATNQENQVELKVGNVHQGTDIADMTSVHTVQLEPELKEHFTLQWVPDENKLAYLTIEKGAYQLREFDLDNQQERVVHAFDQAQQISNIDFAEQGQHYFYGRTVSGTKLKASVVMNNRQMNAPMDLVEFKEKGETITAKNTPIIQYSAVSPDRRWLAFTKYNQGTKTYNLWVHDLTTNQAVQVSEETLGAKKPTWSANSQLVAFTLAESEQTDRVMVYDALNRKNYQITRDSGKSIAPSWLGETQLVFGSSHQDVARIYVADLGEFLADALVTEQQPETIDEQFDIAILHGTVIDPETETIKFDYNVGIKDGKIAVITQAGIKGKETIDATDQVVSPGFIDVLSYNPNNVGNIYKVTDGVTTNLEMHGAVLDFDSYFRSYGKQQMLLNYGGAIQQVKMRMELGIGRYDSPTPEQIEKMKEMTEKAIKQGAIGISFSPEYYPGISSEEIMAIMEVGKKYGMTTFFHARYSTMEGEKNNFDALEEIIGYARKLGVPVQVSHINSTGGTFSMEQSLKMIHDARAEGLDVTIDLYPYNYWATYANSARFDEGWRERFRIDYSDLQVGGSTERLTKETFEKYRQTRTLLIAYAIPEEDVELAIQEEHAMIGSDTIIQPGFNNHPRGAGTFARTIGMYARDKNIISLMQALQMMTINTVKRLENVAPALETKGRLREGMDADITIFDYNTIIDTATPENTIGISKGIPYVMVNGVIVVDPEGVRKNVSPGKPIRSYFE